MLKKKNLLCLYVIDGNLELKEWNSQAHKGKQLLRDDFVVQGRHHDGQKTAYLKIETLSSPCRWWSGTCGRGPRRVWIGTNKRNQLEIHKMAPSSLLSLKKETGAQHMLWMSQGANVWKYQNSNETFLDISTGVIRNLLDSSALRISVLIQMWMKGPVLNILCGALFSFFTLHTCGWDGFRETFC